MKKNHEVRVRLSKDELESIKRKASRAGLTLSSFFRVIGLAADIQPTNGLQSA